VAILQVKVKIEKENMKHFLKLNRHLSEIENVFTNKLIAVKGNFPQSKTEINKLIIGKERTS
jgi:hypothetical protein